MKGPSGRLDHAAHRPAAKDVQMEMRHLLHAVRPGIGDGAEALPLVQRKVQITGQVRRAMARLKSTISASEALVAKSS